MAPLDRHSVDELLAQGEWIHRLARRLVGEPEAAADAAQAALVVALERPPGAEVPLRRWLAGVLRNVVRQDRRTAVRRRDRDLARRPEEATPATDDLVARLELHQRLIRHVRELDEPYRSTIALRFLDDLSVKEIAARQGVPTKTVYTRIERALATLRARLDREHGSRSAWALVLVPALPVKASAAPLAPLLTMATMQWTAALGAALALGALGFFVLRPDSPRAVPAPAANPETPTASAELRGERLDAPSTARTAQRETQTAPSSVPSATPAAKDATTMLRGVVLDLAERPVEGATVAYRAPEGQEKSWAGDDSTHVVSDARGEFELPLPRFPSAVFASKPGYATVLAPVAINMARAEPVRVWIGPSRGYAGHVVDVGGNPVEGAQVEIRLSEETLRRLEPGAYAGRLSARRTTSDADGAFRFEAVGVAEGSTVVARKPGFVEGMVGLPSESRHDLLVELRHPRPDEIVIAGVVRLPDGTPAVRAYVAIGPAQADVAPGLRMLPAVSTRTDDAGRFALSSKDTGVAAESGVYSWQIARAVLPGHSPAIVRLADQPDWLRLELELGPEPHSLRGTVVDARGEPVRGAHVWSDDGEPFGLVTRDQDGLSFQMVYDVERIVSGDDRPRGGRDARTDSAGRFAWRGLLDRTYTAYVRHPETHVIAGPFFLRGGDPDAYLVIGDHEELRPVAGLVTNYAGEPLAGVRVMVERRLDLPDGTQLATRAEPTDGVRTDEEGRFSFPSLAIRGTELLVVRESPQSRRVELGREPDLRAIRVRLPAPCDLRIELADPERARAFRLLDESGAPMDLLVQAGGMVMMSNLFPLRDGVSDLVRTDESATTLELQLDGRTVQSIPLRLRPGEVNVLRP